MSKIIKLFCAGGFSSSLLVTKMQEYAAKQGYDYQVSAYAVTQCKTEGADADAILVGPQVRFDIPKIKKMYPDKPVESIEMRAYGTMNGKACIEQARKLMGDA
jgi:PTS system cellobiose-specific IIB component